MSDILVHTAAWQRGTNLPGDACVLVLLSGRGYVQWQHEPIGISLIPPCADVCRSTYYSSA